MATKDFKELACKVDEYKKPVRELKELEKLFIKACVNAYRAVDLDNENKSMLYKRADLSEWAKEAFDKGEKYFYCEPVNKDDPCGRLRLCKPKYVYQLKRDLTEEEFNELFKKED